MPDQQAVKTLEAAKLKLTATDTRTTGTQKPGIVIEQSPKAKETAPVGGGVTLVVEVAPEMVTVPNVIGVPVDKVGPMLKGKLQLRTEPKSAGAKPGTIVDQNPKPDASVAPGTIITAFVEPRSVVLGHPFIKAVAISNRWAVTGSADKTARLWDLGKPATF